MMKTKKRKLCFVGLAALFALCFSAVPALADTTGETTVTVGFVAGELEIVSVPQNLSFGTQNTLQPTPFRVNLANSYDIVVSDATDALAGWRLTADLGQFTNTGGTPGLENAAIVATGVEPVGNSTVYGLAASPPVVRIVSSAATDATIVMNANARAGFETWTATLTPTNTYLDILGGTTVTNSTYTATMEWLLSVGPTA